MSRLISLLTLMAILSHSSVQAQRYFGASKETFGKSKIQNKNFQWSTFSTPNFEFNFYRGGDLISKRAADYVEKAYPRVTSLLGYMPYDKTSVFIFNSVNDINATNLVDVNVTVEDYTVVDEKNARILTAYSKNDSLFHKELLKNITSVYVYDMLYGGNVREALESQILLNLPLWFTEGIAAYIAEENNGLLFDEFKTAITQAQNTRLGQLKDQQAELIGQSIWNYIAVRYGKDQVSNILNLTRIIHDEQSSITSSLGISFNRFLQEWKNFYLNSAPITDDIEPQKPLPKVKEVVRRINDLKTGEVDTDHYIFDPSSLERYKNEKSLLSNLSSNARPTPGLPQMTNGYSATKLFQNFLVSDARKVDIVVDPVRQFGLGYSLALHDLLQNNVFKFDGYLKPTSPLFRSFDYSLEYANYAKKIDFSVKYEKRSIYLETVDYRDGFLLRPLNYTFNSDVPEYLLRRVISQRISASFSYPFSNKLRLQFTPSYVKNDDLDYQLLYVDGIPSDQYIAPNVQLIYDNTKINKYGVEYGTKIKFSYDKYYHLKNNLRNFQTYYFDVRHYQKILRGLMAAGRLSYGVSEGNAAKYTFIGGAENSINRTNYRSNDIIAGKDTDLRNILFYNFPGNLRGFDFGRLYGNNHLLGNVELRSHMAEILPQMALSSSFLRNLQFVGFFDIGSAWIGKKGPFSRENSLNTTTTGAGGPFVIEVTNFKYPFLSGFGGGVRSSILGIFIKADYGFGIEDKEILSPKFHLSLGKDF